jgi:hypothetical protein
VGSTDLLQTMWLTIGRLAINKRDKVFRILGIASDSQDIVPAADYSLTVSDLYWSLAESMIAKRGDLDYLSKVFDPDEIGQVPLGRQLPLVQKHMCSILRSSSQSFEHLAFMQPMIPIL